MARPPKPAHERYRTPARQLGRIPEDEWDTIQSAAAKAGKTLTEWAKEILLRNARRQLGKQ